MKKKKKLTRQQIKFIINIVSLAIFAFSYLYIYTGMENKTDEIYQEIKSTKKRIETVKEKESQKEKVKQDTQEKNKQIQSILDAYPVNITKVDNLLFVEQMGKELGITFSNVNATDSVYFCDTILPKRNADGTEISQSISDSSDNGNKTEITVTPKAENSVGSKSQTAVLDEIEAEADKKSSAQAQAPAGSDFKETTTITGLQSTITMSFETTADGFRKLIDYITGYPGKAVIDSVSVTVDSTTNRLTGSIVIKRFALAGTGKEYIAPEIDDISIGTDDIFGIGSGASGTKKNPPEATEEIAP